MLDCIAKLDKKISKPLITMDNLLVTIILYPFAAFFHPKLIFLAYGSVYYLSGKDIRSTIVYAVGTALCLITSTVLKKLFKR